MNPTFNKNDFEDLTTHLRDLAYSYLEKYSPSKQQLKVFLLKKYLTKIKCTKSKKEVAMLHLQTLNINPLNLCKVQIHQRYFRLSKRRKINKRNLQLKEEEP